LAYLIFNILFLSTDLESVCTDCLGHETYSKKRKAKTAFIYFDRNKKKSKEKNNNINKKWNENHSKLQTYHAKY
jgi:hypothetical protein